ncbi:MAG: response regulator [Lachnospiraceae bacterium]|jgi:CheY-like chemotaxis protein|nr:response regulator [Lachnospiraceae bacterium]MDY2760073.1 response regulator [Lachnospiraceae bacterium]
MFSQLFGHYLIDKRIITPDEYRATIENQLKVRVKLGTIAIADGLLTEEQVDDINRLQMQQDKRFGDIAVEMGLLTEEQISSLLAKQGNPYMQFVESITQSTGLSAGVIEKTLAVYQKENGFTDQDMEALKNDDIGALIPVFAKSDNPLVTAIAGLVIKNVNRFITRDYYVGHISKAKSLSYHCLAGQRITGSGTYYAALAASADDEAFQLVAGRFSGVKAARGSADSFDGVCEFINVNDGLFASDQSENAGREFELEPVEAYQDQKVTGDFYILPIYIEEQPITLVIADQDITPGQTRFEFESNTKQVYQPADDSRASVMIVDDSHMARTVLKDLLERNGYSVIAEATNGREAVEIFHDNFPDLITLDITMPEMDGVECLKRILDIDPDQKVIMITAAGQQSKVVEALKLGAKQFITKPFEKDVVLRSIREVLDQ